MALRFKDYARILKGEPGYSPSKAQYRSASNPSDVISGRQFTTGAKGGQRYEKLARKQGGSLRTPTTKAPKAPKVAAQPKRDLLSYLPGWKKVRTGNKTRYESEQGISLSPARAKQYIDGKGLRDQWAFSLGGRKIDTAFQKKHGFQQYEFTDKSAMLAFVASAGLPHRYSVTALGVTKTAGGSGGDASGRLKWRGKFFASPPYEWMSLGSYDNSVVHPDRGVEERITRYFGTGEIVVYSVSF